MARLADCLAKTKNFMAVEDVEDVQAITQELVDQGVSQEDAEFQAVERVFGTLRSARNSIIQQVAAQNTSAEGFVAEKVRQEVETEAQRVARQAEEAAAVADIPFEEAAEPAVPDLETAIGMVETIRRVANQPKPKSLSQFLKDEGGVNDEGGDIKNIIGTGRARPGLISGNGMPLDTAARKAWDAGYLTNATRPDINALLDAIETDMGVAPVYSSNDTQALEDREAADHARETLKPFGITGRDTPKTIADKLGVARQVEALDEQDRAKFDEVLRSKTPRKNWAKETGVTDEQMEVLINEAVEDGRLVMRGGKPQRSRQLAAQDRVDQETTPVETPVVDLGVADHVVRLRTRQQRVYARDLVTSLMDSKKFFKTLVALDGDKNMSDRQVKEVVRAYIGNPPGLRIKSRAQAQQLAEDHFNSMQRDVRTAQASGQSIELMPSNLAWNIAALRVLEERVKKLKSGGIDFDDHVAGVIVEAGRSLGGYYNGSKRILALAVDGRPIDVMATLDHETVHMLKDLVWDKKTWSVLESKANSKPKRKEALRIIERLEDQNQYQKWTDDTQTQAVVDKDKIASLKKNAGKLTYMEIYDIAYRYAHAVEPGPLQYFKIKRGEMTAQDLLMEEAVAHMSEDWTDGREFGNAFDRAAIRVMDLIESIKNFFNDAGFTNTNEIFSSMYSGQLREHTSREQQRQEQEARSEASQRMAQLHTQINPASEVTQQVDREKGAEMRTSFDNLGFYSQALETAKALKQKKGTPEQFKAQLKKAGVKDAEFELTGLNKFFEGKKSITKEELVKHIEDNRVTLEETQYVHFDIERNANLVIDGEEMRADQAIERYVTDPERKQRLQDEFELIMASRVGKSLRMDGFVSRVEIEVSGEFGDSSRVMTARTHHAFETQAPRWNQFSLFPDNATYRETVLSLPNAWEVVPSPNEGADGLYSLQKKNGEYYMDEKYGMPAHWVGRDAAEQKADALNVIHDAGHFDQPNIVGHMMTSMVKHKGKPTFLLDQVQSDWGQQLRDSGEPLNDEKIAEFGRQLDSLERRRSSVMKEAEALYNDFEVTEARQERRDTADKLSRTHEEKLVVDLEWLWAESNDDVASREANILLEELTHIQTEERRINSELSLSRDVSHLTHPLVATTDMWTNIVLGRALRQAAEADVDYIAVPSGSTVLSYNPGDDHGMRVFYGAEPRPDRAAAIRKDIGDLQRQGLAPEQYADLTRKLKAAEEGTEGIVPKNLRKLLQKLDKESARPEKIEKVQHPRSTGDAVVFGEDLDLKGQGFTIFPLTEKAKEAILERGQRLYQLSTPVDADMSQEQAATSLGFRQISAGQIESTPDEHKAGPNKVYVTSDTVVDGPVASSKPAPGVHVRGELVSSSDYSAQFFEFSGTSLASATNEELRHFGRRTDDFFKNKGYTGVKGLDYVAMFNENDVRPAGHDFKSELEGVASDTEERLFSLKSMISEDPAPPSLNQVLQNLKKSLGLQVTQMMYGVDIIVGDRKLRLRPPKNMRAQYRRDTGAAGVRSSRDIKAIARAGGFALERMIGKPLTDILEAHKAELVPGNMIIPPDETALSEGFTRFFERYVMDRKGAEETAPNFLEAFEEMLDAENPVLLQDLNLATDQYQEWLNRSTIDEMSSDVVSTYDDNDWKSVQDGSKNWAETRNGWFAKTYTGVIDDQAPIRQLVRRLLGVADRNGVVDEQGRPISLKFSENAYKMARMFRGAYATGYSYITDGIPNYGSADVQFPSLQMALDTLFRGETYTKEGYKAFGQYLISRRAVAEYDLLEKKERMLAEHDKNIQKYGEVSTRLNQDQARDRAVVQRRQTTLNDIEGQIKATNAEHRRATREEQQLVERLDDVQDLLGIAEAGYPENVIQQYRRRVAVIQKQASDRRRQRDRLAASLDNLNTDADFLRAEIQAKSFSMQARQEQMNIVSDALAAEKKERDSTAQRGASRPPTLESREWHASFIQKMEADPKYKNIRRAAAIAHDHNWGLLTLRYQAGLIPEDQYKELSKRKNYYVPFMRDMSDATAVQSGNLFGGKSRSWSPFKKFEGSDRAIINPLQTMSEQAYRTAQHIAMNDMVKSLAGLAERAGEGSADIAQVLETRSTEPEAFDKLVEYAMQFGIEHHDAVQIAQQMEVDFTNSDLETIWSPVSKGPLQYPTLPLWREGKRTFVAITDQEFGQDAVNAMKGLGQEQINMILDTVVGTPARALQIGVTTHPTFMPRNLIRDMFDAWIKVGALPIITQVEGAYKMAKDPEFMRRYMVAGGITGGRNIAALTQMEKQQSVLDLDPNKVSVSSIAMGAVVGAISGTVLGGPIGGMIGAATLGAPVGAAVGALGLGYATRKGQVLKLVESVETMTRIGVAAKAYREVKANDPTLSEQDAIKEAAFIARDIFDWNRRGSRTLSVLRIVTFLNAQLQGMDKAARSLAGSGDRGSAVARHLRTVMNNESGITLSRQEEIELGQAYKTFYRMMLYTAGLIGLYALAMDDDDYEDLKDRTKSTHSWLPDWFGADIRIPKAFEWAMPANMIEIIWDANAGRDPRWAQRMVSSTYEVMVPPAMPQAYTLFTGWMTGQQVSTLTEEPRNIIPYYQQGKAPELQFNAYTSLLARDVAKGMANLGLPNAVIPSPYQVDFTLRTGGYWGQDISKAYGFARDAVTGRTGMYPRVPDWPVLGGFTGTSARQSQSVDQFYKLVSRGGGYFYQAADGYRDYLNNQGDEVEARSFLLRLPPDQRAYALMQYHGKAWEKRLHPLNRLERLNSVMVKFGQDIVSNTLTPGRRTRRTAEDFAETIDLDPKVKTSLVDTIEKLRRAEAWNTMIFMDRPGWQGKAERNVEEIMETLKSVSPEAYEIFVDRMDEKKVEDWGVVKDEWPDLEQEILREHEFAF